MGIKVNNRQRQLNYKKSIIKRQMADILELINDITEYQDEIINFKMPSYDYMVQAYSYILKAKIFLGKSYKDTPGVEDQLKMMLGDNLEIIDE